MTKLVKKSNDQKKSSCCTEVRSDVPQSMKYVDKQIEIECNCSSLVEEFDTIHLGDSAKKPQDYACRYEQSESQKESQAGSEIRQRGSRQLLGYMGWNERSSHEITKGVEPQQGEVFLGMPLLEEMIQGDIDGDVWCPNPAEPMKDPKRTYCEIRKKDADIDSQNEDEDENE